MTNEDLQQEERVLKEAIVRESDAEARLITRKRRAEELFNSAKDSLARIKDDLEGAVRHSAAHNEASAGDAD